MAVKLYGNVEVLEAGDVDFADAYTLYDARYVKKSGDTMFGDYTLTGALLIHGGADTLQLKIKGDSSQSANLTEWQSSGGAVLAKVASDGALTIGDSADARTYIGPAPSANYHYNLRYANSAAEGGLMNLVFTKTVGVNGGVYYGQNTSLNMTVSSSKTASEIYGQNFSVLKQGDGEVNYLRGSYYNVEAAGTSIANNAFGLQAYLYAGGTATLQRGYGLHVAGGKASGATFNRMYGLYIEDINFAALEDYALLTNRGDVRLMSNAADKLGFHGATPIAQQTVTGSRGGNAALASLLTRLANLGLVVDSSS